MKLPSPAQKFLKERNAKRSSPAAFTRRNFSRIGPALVCFALGAGQVQGTPYYWDTNDVTAGSGAATGTWGTSTFWTTDSTGSIVPTVALTTNGDDLFFSAGTTGATGTVTISGTQSARSITFDDAVPLTLSGGTAINLGNAAANSGISATAAGNNTISTPITFNSAATAVNFSNSSTGTLQINGSVTGSASTGTQTLTLTNSSSGSVNVGGNISDGLAGGNVALVRSGNAGTITLSGTNTYTGTTTVNGGVLLLGKRVSLYGADTSKWTPANITVNTGATVAFSVGGTGEFTTGDVTTLLGNLSTVSNNGLKAGSSIGFSTASGTFTVADNIANSTGTGGGAIGVTKLGAGTLVLSGSNSYTGGTTVTAGSVNVTGDQSLATGGWSIANATANFQAGSNIVVASNKGVSTHNIGTLGVAGTVRNYGTLLTGFRGTLTINAGADWTQYGAMNISVNQATTSYGTAMTVSGGTFTYAGTTAITLAPCGNAGGSAFLNLNGGTFVTGAGLLGANSSGGGSSNLTFNGGTLRLSGNIGSLVTLAGAAPFNVQLGTNGAIIDTNGFSTTITQGIANVSGQTGSLTKNGAGILTLGAANTYAGATNVNGGTLNLTGSLNSDITVANGAKLAGPGSTTKSITLNDGSTIVGGTSAITGTGVVANKTSSGVSIVLTGAATTAGAKVSDVIKYSTGTAPTVANFNATQYRSGVVSDDSANQKITLSYTADAKTWNTTTGNWEINSSANWTGTSDNVFFQGDSVTFNEPASTSTVSLNGALAPSAVTVTNSGNTYTFSGTGSVVGGGALTKTGNGTLIITTNNSYSGGTTISGGTVQVGNGGTTGNLGSGAVTNNASLLINRSDEVFISNAIDGSGTLTQAGSGRLILDTANTYTGATSVGTGSTLNIRNATALGTTAGGVTVNSGGALEIQGGITVGTEALALAGTGVAGNGALRSIGGANSMGGTVALSGGTTKIQVDADALTLSNVISGANQALTKDGSGSLSLSSSNTYSGATTISKGILIANTLAPNGTASSIGQGTALTLDNGTLRYTGSTNVGSDTLSSQFNRSITVNPGGGTIDIAGNGFVFYNGTLTGSGTLTVLDTSGDTNNRQLLVTGNSPDFTGNIVIGNGSPNSGWIQYRSNAASPFGSGRITVNTGGILSTDKAGTGGTTPAFLTNNILLNGGTLQAQGVATQHSGSITANAGTTSFLAVGTGSSASNLVLTGSLLDSGSLVKASGDRSIELRGDNSSFTGAYSHTAAGATIFYTANSGSASASWNIPAGSDANARFMAGGANLTYKFGALSGTTGLLENFGAASGNSTFEIGALNTNTTFGGVIQDNGGTVAINKVGNGILTLTGTNTYIGQTTVSGGTLAVSGSISGSSQIAVQNSGSLLLSGASADRINNTADVTLGGGTGSGPATLQLADSGISETVGALTLASNSVLDFGNATSGSIFHFGDSDAKNWGTSTLSIWNWTPSLGDKLFFDFSSGAALTPGQLNSITFYSGAGTGWVGTAAFVSGDSGELTAVPEPSTVVSGLAMLGYLFFHRRRTTR